MVKVTWMPCTAVVLGLLAGCTAYDRVDSIMTKPVIQSVKKGMTREQVRMVAGAPATEITMVYAHGTCQTYVLSERDGKFQTYFVSYDASGHVMNYGFQSCQEYDTDPQLAE